MLTVRPTMVIIIQPNLGKGEREKTISMLLEASIIK